MSGADAGRDKPKFTAAHKRALQRWADAPWPLDIDETDMECEAAVRALLASGLLDGIEDEEKRERERERFAAEFDCADAECLNGKYTYPPHQYRYEGWQARAALDGEVQP